MTFNYWQMNKNVLETLYTYQQQNILCDVKIFTRDGCVPAHRVILSATCQYFRDFEETEAGSGKSYSFPLENMNNMNTMLKYLYTGELDLDEENVKSLYNLGMFLKLPNALSLLKQKYLEQSGKFQQEINLSQVHSGVCVPYNTSDYMPPNLAEAVRKRSNLCQGMECDLVQWDNKTIVDSSNNMVNDVQNRSHCPPSCINENFDKVENQFNKQASNEEYHQTENNCFVMTGSEENSYQNTVSVELEEEESVELEEEESEELEEGESVQSDNRIGNEKIERERNLFCVDCNKVIEGSYRKYKTHLRNFHDRRVWRCGMCHHICNSVSDLMKHKKNVHLDATQTYKCRERQKENVVLQNFAHDIQKMETDGNMSKNVKEHDGSKFNSSSTLLSQENTGKTVYLQISESEHEKKIKSSDADDQVKEHINQPSRPDVYEYYDMVKQAKAQIQENQEEALIGEKQEKAQTKEKQEEAQSQEIQEEALIREKQEEAQTQEKQEKSKTNENQEKALVEEKQEKAKTKENQEKALVEEKQEKSKTKENQEKAQTEEKQKEAETKKETQGKAQTKTQIQEYKQLSKFSCRTCKVEFSDRTSQKWHRHKFHPSKNRTCEICNQVMNSPLRLIDHKFKMHGIPYDMEKYKSFQCKYDGCTYTNICEIRVKQHSKESHTKSETCPVCKKMFPPGNRFRRHLDTHKDVSRVCEQCGQKFKTKFTLKGHIKSVHDKVKQPGYLCHLCPMEFSKKLSIETHLLRCHNEVMPGMKKRVRRCHLCDFATLTPNDLKKHNLLHEDKGRTIHESLLQELCRLCGSKKVSSLNRRDNSKRRIACETCGKLVQKEYLNRHYKNVHGESKKCPYEDCTYSSPSKQALKGHIFNMHTDKDTKPYGCHLCEYKCKLCSNLTSHMKHRHDLIELTVHKRRKIAMETGKGYQYTKSEDKQFLKRDETKAKSDNLNNINGKN